MFSSNTNSFSEFHLPYTDKGPLAGRSYSPFDPTIFQLEEELIFEQLFFQEEQMDEARDDGGVNGGVGIGHMREEKNIDGTDQDVVQSVSSSDGVFVSKVWAGKKSRSKVAGSRKSKSMPRKRTGKKDRHSKIHTAQGLRDRRIRLSVHIARKFFDLQEMLGVDKASKTIEWLLEESHGAIDELFKKKLSPLNMDSTPESVVASETKEAEVEVVEEGEEDEERLERTRSKGHMTLCEMPITWTRRDLRDKARQRARERTREKLMMKGLNVEDPNKDREEGRNFDGSHNASRVLGPPKDPDCDSANDMNCLSIIEKFLGIKSVESKPDTHPDQNIRNIVDFLEGLSQPRTPPNSFSVRSPNGQKL